MKYTVVWQRVADFELATIYLATKYRPAVSEAVNRIDKILARDPGETGESRYGDLRIVFERPLAFTFEVLENDRLVRVLHVWEFDTHS